MSFLLFFFIAYNLKLFILMPVLPLYCKSLQFLEVGLQLTKGGSFSIFYLIVTLNFSMK